MRTIDPEPMELHFEWIENSSHSMTSSTGRKLREGRKFGDELTTRGRGLVTSV